MGTKLGDPINGRDEREMEGMGQSCLKSEGDGRTANAMGQSQEGQFMTCMPKESYSLN